MSDLLFTFALPFVSRKLLPVWWENLDKPKDEDFQVPVSREVQGLGEGGFYQN